MKQRGFTLLEVMIVLLIIGITASVVTYNAISSNKQDARIHQPAGR